MTHTPIRVGLLSLSLDLYRTVIPDTVVQYQSFHAQLRDLLGGLGHQVVADGFGCTREEIEQAIQRIQIAGADVLVVVLQSYSASLNSLMALLRTPLPLLIWNTQSLAGIDESFDTNQMLLNHGMHGVQDFCNCLLRSGCCFGLVSGHWKDEQHRRELDGWLRAAEAVSFSRRVKVGRMGPAFQGMGDFRVDETRLLAEWGPAVENLSVDELALAAAGVSDEELREEIRQDRERFEFSPDISEESHSRSARLSVALRRVVEAHQVNAYTMHFGVFGEDPRIATCPFLGVNHLMAAGYGYAGEGDVTTAAMNAVLGRVFGRAGFCEMFTADYDNDRVFFYHMAEGNYALARAGAQPILKEVPYTFGSGQPYLVPIFAYEPGSTTFLNLATNAQGRFYLIAFEAELTDYTRGATLNAPHFMIQLPRRLGDFLSSYSFAGGTHHLNFVQGHQMDNVRRLARMLRMELIEA